MATNRYHVDFTPVSLVIFDLDGTLYDDTRHFDHYAALLREQVPPERREAYDRDYAAAAAGRHPLAIGRLYDNDADFVLEADRRLRIVHGWHWDGTPVPAEELARRYPEPVHPDVQHIVTVGDGWWLPPPCARHHGAPFTQEPFLKTRTLMLSPAYKIRRIPGLRPGLARLKAAGKRLAVCSNSPDGDVQLFLDRLGLLALIDQVYPAAGKPAGGLRAYSALADALGARRDAVLAVGDNYLNDIVPALDLGFQTLLINAPGVAYPDYAGPQARSLVSALRRWQ